MGLLMSSVEGPPSAEVGERARERERERKCELMSKHEASSI